MVGVVKGTRRVCVDAAAVRGCVTRTGSEKAGLYRRTWELSRSAGVTFTPAWAVNGKVVPWTALEGEIQAALRLRR